VSAFDVVVVGAGPAGIFAALELMKNGNLRVALVERGADLEERLAMRQGQAQPQEGSNPMLEGFGGAGAFCDGKLTITSHVGGHLAELLGTERAEELLSEVEQIWLAHGAPRELHSADESFLADLGRRATLCGLKLVNVPLRHMGTDGSFQVLGSMRRELDGKVELITGNGVSRILVEGRKVAGVELDDGTRLQSSVVIVAPGRGGATWLHDEAERLGLVITPGAVDLGVRVEVPAAIVAELTDNLYEFKLLYWARSFDNLVRTFCVCPYGEVITVRHGDVVTVNGHSYAEPTSDNTNFALLVSSRFTEPFDDPISYGQHIARLANLLGDSVLVQRLGDLRVGRRSTPSRLRHSILEPTLKSATPGDLSYVLPYRHLRALLEMIEALDKLAPGVGAGHTLLYGVEVKLYSSRLQTDDRLRTEISGLYACGDGAGLTRGLMQASASGLWAGRCVAEALGE